MDELITKPLKRLIATSKNYAKHQIGELYGLNTKEDTLILSDMKVIRSEKVKYSKNSNKNLNKSCESTNIILSESNFYNNDISDFSINKSFTPPKSKPELVTVKLFPSPKKCKISYVEINNDDDTKENVPLNIGKEEKPSHIAIELIDKHENQNDNAEGKKKIINIKFTLTKTKSKEGNDQRTEESTNFVEYVQHNDFFPHENCQYNMENDIQNYSDDTANLLQKIYDYFIDNSQKDVETTDLDNLDFLNEITVPRKTISEASFHVQTTNLDESLKSVPIADDLKCPNNSQTDMDLPDAESSNNMLQIIDDYFSKYCNKSVQTTDLDNIFTRNENCSIPEQENSCIFEENKSIGTNEEFQPNEKENPFHSTQHDFSSMANETGKSSLIFGPSKNRSLSPISTENPFPKVQHLIKYHESLTNPDQNLNRRHSLPILGRARLMEKVECTDQSKLNDSEIIHKLVHDRFIVNAYTNRLLKKVPKKPARFGKIYRSLERRLRTQEEKGKLSNTFHEDIIPLETSSPIKLDSLVFPVVLSENHDYSRISEETSDKDGEDADKKDIQNMVEGFHSSSLEEATSFANVPSNCAGDNNQQCASSTLEEVPQNQLEEQNKQTSCNSPSQNENRYSSSTVFDEMPEQDRSFSPFDSEYASASQFSENYCNSTDDFTSFSDYLTAANIFKNYEKSGTLSKSLVKEDLGSSVTKEKVEKEVEKSRENTLGNEISYDMDEFLKKALGDELNEETFSLIGQDDKKESEYSQPLNEDSVCTSDASDLLSKVNTFRSSIYKSLTRRLKRKTNGSMHSSSTVKEEKSNADYIDSAYPNTPQAEELLRQASLQYEAMQQLSKALTLCKNTKEFSSSGEQIEAERLLLLAKHRREALYAELRNLDYEQNIKQTPHVIGSLIITDLTFPLKRIIDRDFKKHHDQWFVCLITNGPTVIATKCVLAKNLNYVEFEEEITCSDLTTDFMIIIEIFSFLQKKSSRNFSHESKYHLNKDMKSSSCPVPKNIMHKEKSLSKTLSRANTGIHASSFRLNGVLKLKATDISKKDEFKLQKVPLSSSLQGYVSFRMRSQVKILTKYSGFLTIGTIEHDHYIWNRRWCLLQGNIMYFWNYPCNIEDDIHPLDTIDLRRCMNYEIQSVDREVCPRPRTLLLETIETDNENLCKHFINFDNWSEMKEWQNHLNEIVHILRSWNDSYLK